MRKFIVLLTVSFVCLCADAQVFKFKKGVYDTGEKYAETISMEPQKVIEQKDSKTYVLGNMIVSDHLKTGPRMGLSIWQILDPLKRVERILKMKDGIMKITLSNGEVLSHEILGIIDAETKMGKEVVLIFSLGLFDSSNTIANKYELYKRIFYMIKQLSQYDIVKIQVNDVVFNFSKSVPAKEAYPFRTAETFKAMMNYVMSK